MIETRGKLSGRGALLGLGLVGGILVLAAAWYYMAQEKHLRDEVHEQLSSIARLKTEQIVAWRNSCAEEGTEVTERPLFRVALLDWLERPGDHERAVLLQEFGALQRIDGYADVALVDASGRFRLGLAGEGAVGARSLAPGERDSLASAWRQRRVVLTDLLNDPAGGAPSLCVIAPILAADGAPRGALLLFHDARKSLFPILNSWPTASSSGETYLVRREGGAAVILNDLRHLPPGAPHERIPIDAPDRAASRVARGVEGPMDGRDYRGVPVLTHALAIPGSNWFLVAKIDTAEALADGRLRSLLILTILLGVAGLITAIVFGIRQREIRGRFERFYEAEASLREGEARYRTLFESNPHPMWVFDLGTLRFLAVNQAAISHYGYTREEFLAMTIADIRPAEDLDRLRQNLATGSSGLDRAGIWRHRRRDGSLIDVEITSHTLDFEGHASELVLAHDVTDRLRAEEALRRSEEQLSLALLGSSDGLWDRDLVSGGDYLSPRWKELLGYGPDELPEHQDSFFAYLHPDDASRVSEAVREHVEGDIPFDVELRLRTREGTYRWFRARGRATRDQAGRAVRMAGTIADIHERRLAEQGLQRANRALRTMTRCNETLVHATDEIQLLRDVCQLVVEQGGYRMAWVGFAADDERRRVWPVASAGFEAGYLEASEISWADTELGRGPTGTAIRERRVVVVRHIDTDANFAAWRDSARARGYASSIALPLATQAGDCLGALSIYAAEPDAFDDEEIALLTELSGDLAFGIRAIRDRAGRNAIQEDLRATTARLEHLLEASPTIVYSIRFRDDRPRPESVTDNVVRILGYSKEQALEPGWWQAHIHPSDRERTLAALAGSDPPAHISHEYRFERADGTWIWVHDELRLIRGPDGEPAEYVGAWNDVSLRRQAEESVRESEERLRLALHAANQGLYDLDIRSGVTVVSPEYATMLGYDAASFRETNAAWIERLHPDDREQVGQVYRDFVAGRIPAYRVEFRQRTASGEWKWILSIGNIAERDAEGRPVRMLGTHTDITERRQAEEEREKLQAQLLQAQKMELVGQLAGGVAHDFNNMLTVILGQAEIALVRVEPSHPIRAHLLEVRRAAQRSSELTRQLLAYARRQTVAPKVLDLNDTLERMLNLLRRLIGEDIDLAWRPGRDLWSVRMDPSQIDQILTNLCVNARDAITGVGKITIETANTAFDEAHVASHPGFQPGEYVMLAVSDDGSGMEPEVLEHVFEPFYTTKSVGEGTGLGLSTVYGITKQNQGFVHVYSEPGKGTTFRIYLRRHLLPAEEPEPATRRGAPLGRGETILLVEDEPSILRLGVAILEDLGYAVLAAASPEEALRRVTTDGPAIRLLVTDLILPGMNGKDLSARLTEQRPGLKTLYMSGYTANVIAHRGVLYEGVHFIQKPFSVQALALKVREVLDEG